MQGAFFIGGYMIVITKENNCITIIGHANYAPIGQDIVCAGISTVVQSLIRSIETLTSDKIKYDMKPGKVHINFEKSLSEDAQLLVDSFFIAVEAIAENYPNHVKVLSRRGRH